MSDDQPVFEYEGRERHRRRTGGRHGRDQRGARRALLRDYRRDHTRYTEQQLVPPSFLGALRFRPGPDPRVRYGNATFHAGARAELFEPIRVGDTITGWEQAQEVYAKPGRSGTMVFSVRRLTYRNQHGVDVGYSDQTWVYRQVGE